MKVWCVVLMVAAAIVCCVDAMNMMNMMNMMPAGVVTSLDDDIFTQTYYKDTDQGAAPVPVTLESLTDTVRTLARIIIELQQSMQDRVRSEGRSGIKQTRNDMSGPHSYFENSHLRMKLANIHDHSQNKRTLGVGEFIAVLNGVEFGARHNDYRLYMPSINGTELFEMDNIPFPDVPPEVLNKTTVQEQTVEMKEWFKAWLAQDRTQRDYTKYFQANLCYLEGAWFYPDSVINKTFWSDRHFMDASTWFELLMVNRFNSFTGSMKGNENLANLPRILLDMIYNQTTPVVAQFDYRMLCQPLDRDLPLNRLKIIDELHYRVPYKKRLVDMGKSKSARYQLNPQDSDTWWPRHQRFTLLDQLMTKIPGLDNRQAYIEDNTYGVPKYDFLDQNKRLNAGYYGNWHKAGRGNVRAKRHRGYSDTGVYMAYTTQDKVAKFTLTSCDGEDDRRTCTNYKHRVSYAIPFEIVYTTPLSKWNPWNIEYKGLPTTIEGATVTAGKRNGGLDVDKAYNGSNEIWFYQTPREFYTGESVGNGTPSMSDGDRGVLDATGQIRMCRGSGHRIFMDITGVGLVRQRYPVMPIHAEGGITYKELEALKQLVLRAKSLGYLYAGY